MRIFHSGFAITRSVEWLWNRRVQYWAICSFVRSHCTAHSFACSALLATLARSAALICSLTRSLTPELMGKRFLSAKYTRRFHTLLAHCAPPAGDLLKDHTLRALDNCLSHPKKSRNLKTTPEQIRIRVRIWKKNCFDDLRNKMDFPERIMAPIPSHKRSLKWLPTFH